MSRFHSTYSDGSLDLGELLLVVLSLGRWVLLEPLGLLLDSGQNGLLVVRRDLSAKTLLVTNLGFEGEDEV